MDEFEEAVNSTQQKIQRLKSFITLHLRRSSVKKELQNIMDQVVAMRDLLTAAHKLMQDHHNRLEDETKEVMTQMRYKQSLMLAHLIKEKKRKLQEEADKENEQSKMQLLMDCGNVMSAVKKNGVSNLRMCTTPVPKSALKSVTFNLAQLQLSQQGVSMTPKIKISDYKASPLVKKRVMPIPIQFTEFDIQVTQQQFDKIPKYMCGRETLDNLNAFLETVIIPCFNEKYQLLHKQRGVLRNPADLELWRLYNEQASYLPGRMFITPGDITRIVNKMLDKKAQNRLTMLRHLGILHEQRVNQTICYVWSHNGVL